MKTALVLAGLLGFTLLVGCAVVPLAPYDGYNHRGYYSGDSGRHGHHDRGYYDRGYRRGENRGYWR